MCSLFCSVQKHTLLLVFDGRFTFAHTHTHTPSPLFASHANVRLGYDVVAQHFFILLILCKKFVERNFSALQYVNGFISWK
jgi:hypothetical protein